MDHGRQRRFGRRAVGLIAALSLGLVTVVAACGGASPGAGSGQPIGGGGRDQPLGGGGAGQPLGGNPPLGATGVPGWVRVGHRLTWYVAAASIAQSRYSWVEDPDGTWEDPQTGKKYRRSDEDSQGLPGAGQPTASGDGLVQIDVVGIEDSQVVLAMNVYTIDRSGSQLAFLWTPAGGGRVPGATVDGTWIHPAQLQQLLGQATGGQLVLRGPYDLGGTRYEAISITSGPGSNYYSYTYDVATGVLLAATTSTAGATSPFRAAGEAPPVGNTQSTITRFAGARLRTTPGLDGTLPPGLAAAGVLRYGGSYNWTNPIDPSSGNFTYPIEYTVSVGQGGANWRSYAARSFIAGLGEQPLQEGVTGPTGLYGFDPRALATMQAGQVLDQDPFTGQRIAVVGGGAGGGAVTIESQMPGVAQLMQYDTGTGLLLGYDARLPPSGITIQLRLQGT